MMAMGIKKELDIIAKFVVIQESRSYKLFNFLVSLLKHLDVFQIN